MKKLLLPIIAAFGFLAFWRRDSKTPPPISVQPGTGPIHVMGDSYAVGVGAAMKKLYPNRKVTVNAAVGRPASVMSFYPLPDDHDATVVVSAGTNDLAGSADIETIIKKVLSLINDGDDARYVLLLPSLAVKNVSLAERIKDYRASLVPELDTINALYVSLPAPNASDGLHYTPDVYEQIALSAILEAEGVA